jgi:hypothetical protein
MMHLPTKQPHDTLIQPKLTHGPSSLAPLISGPWSSGVASVVDSASLLHSSLQVNNHNETEKSE